MLELEGSGIGGVELMGLGHVEQWNGAYGRGTAAGSSLPLCLFDHNWLYICLQYEFQFLLENPGLCI